MFLWAVTNATGEKSSQQSPPPESTQFTPGWEEVKGKAMHVLKCGGIAALSQTLSTTKTASAGSKMRPSRAKWSCSRSLTQGTELSLGLPPSLLQEKGWGQNVALQGQTQSCSLEQLDTTRRKPRNQEKSIWRLHRQSE